MMRLAIVFVLLAACSGKSKPGATAGSGSDTPVVLAKRWSLSWGIQQGATAAEIFLQTTDETGKQVSHALGSHKGTCSATTPAPNMKALIAVQCKDGAAGTELQAVVQGNQIIVMKMRIDDGVIADPMAREELTRVVAPTGAAIEAG